MRLAKGKSGVAWGLSGDRSGVAKGNGVATGCKSELKEQLEFEYV